MFMTKEPLLTQHRPDKWRVLIRYKRKKEGKFEMLRSTVFDSKYEAEIEATHMQLILENYGKQVWCKVRIPSGIERRDLIMTAQYKALHHKVSPNTEPSAEQQQELDKRLLLREIASLVEVPQHDWSQLPSEDDFINPKTPRIMFEVWQDDIKFMINELEESEEDVRRFIDSLCDSKERDLMTQSCL